jgi:aminopeptidase N
MAHLDPHSFSDPDQGTIARIDFRLEPDFRERVLRVRAGYHLDRPVRGSLFLDSKDLRIERVEAGGRSVRWALDKQDPILGQRLHLMDLLGVDRFSVEVSTTPGAAGLQWLEPPQTAGGVHPYLYTQCQACSARTLFPCQDTPGVRFTYEAELSAPSPLVAVMAADPIGVSPDGAGATHRFVMPQPIPSYLFAFAVANLVFQPLGPRTGIYAEPEIAAAAAWEFAENEDKIRAAEELFGPYLWDRYDLLILPPASPYGGMENPRLTFLNSVYIEGDRSDTWLIAHELAHAWTGNLVTNATWEDFWLNEGPTTYAETRITEVTEGTEAADLRTAGRAALLLRDIERLGATSPMTCLKLPLAGKDPDESYTNIPYYKGLLFFRCLEQAAGRPGFDAFLRDYIDTFRFRSIDSEQFLAYLEAQLPDVARASQARRWIFEPGLPEGAAAIPSTLRDDVLRVSEAYQRGERPTAARVKGWSHNQQSVFLGSLLPRIPAPDCAIFESLFAIRETRDGLLFSRFCELAVRSGYQEVLPAYESFFAAVGRYSFHEPVFRALAEEAWSRQLARPLLERWRHRHHAHTVAAIDRILTQAGL